MFKDIVILISAILLFILLSPIALIFRACYHWKNRNRNAFKPFPKGWLWRLSISIDQMGNVVCDDLLNVLIIDNSSLMRFGDEDETISSVIGKNYKAGKLTKLGVIIRKLLNLLDKNHSVDAVGE